MAAIASKKNHPNSPDHEVAVFKTKVTHELCIPKGLTPAQIATLIHKYLKGEDVQTPEGVIHVKGYEDYYPETSDEVVPVSVSKRRWIF